MFSLYDLLHEERYLSQEVLHIGSSDLYQLSVTFPVVHFASRIGTPREYLTFGEVL